MKNIFIFVIILSTQFVFAQSKSEKSQFVTNKDLLKQYSITATACVVGGSIATGKTVFQIVPFVSMLEIENREDTFKDKFNWPYTTLGQGAQHICTTIFGSIIGIITDSAASAATLCYDTFCFASDWSKGEDGSDKYFKKDEYFTGTKVSWDILKKTWSDHLTGESAKCRTEKKKMDELFTKFQKQLEECKIKELNQKAKINDAKAKKILPSALQPAPNHNELMNNKTQIK